MLRTATMAFLLLVSGITHTLFAADDVAGLIEQVRAVGPRGAGSKEARAACDQLLRKGPEVLGELLEGMETDNVVAANWLRIVFDGIVDRTFDKDPGLLNREVLRACVLDPRRQGRVRRLALGVLAQLDPTTPDILIPPLLNDPEFRYDAVARALDDAETALAENDRNRALNVFAKAFDAARDENQVRTAANRLKELGREVNIVEHLGLLVDWHLVGPFEGPSYEVFSKVFPPEQAVDLQATYPRGTDTIGWKPYRTPDEFGTVNLVTALGSVDDAAAYAYTVLVSDKPRELELRGGADDNFSLWLNRKQIYSKEEWQNGTRFDRFVVPVRLRAGENELLVKICQGPKYDDPGMSNPWSFQLRLCDSAGKGIVLPNRARASQGR